MDDHLACFTPKRSLFQGDHETAAICESGQVGPDIARWHAKRHHIEHAGFRVGTQARAWGATGR
jgi:hypothetical protein